MPGAGSFLQRRLELGQPGQRREIARPPIGMRRHGQGSVALRPRSARAYKARHERMA
jgi:hypothetical protein